MTSFEQKKISRALADDFNESMKRMETLIHETDKYIIDLRQAISSDREDDIYQKFKRKYDKTVSKWNNMLPKLQRIQNSEEFRERMSR